MPKETSWVRERSPSALRYLWRSIARAQAFPEAGGPAFPFVYRTKDLIVFDGVRGYDTDGRIIGR
ncbi:hypothetical protein FHT76_000276 [Rhizobium sp. BK176]|nr:hypothetical protein [Rhizobium sp. BK176]